MIVLFSISAFPRTKTPNTQQSTAHVKWPSVFPFKFKKNLPCTRFMPKPLNSLVSYSRVEQISKTNSKYLLSCVNTFVSLLLVYKFKWL